MIMAFYRILFGGYIFGLSFAFDSLLIRF